MDKTLGTWPHYDFRLSQYLAKKEKTKTRDAQVLVCLQCSSVMLLFTITKSRRIEAEIIKEQIIRGVSNCQ